MSEMHLRQPGFTCMLMGHLLNTKKEYKSLKKQKIHNMFIKTNWTKFAFSIKRLMKILKIYLEKELLINYCVIKHIRLLKTIKIMDINMDLLQWFMIKSFLIVQLHVQINLILKVKLC